MKQIMKKSWMYVVFIMALMVFTACNAKEKEVSEEEYTAEDATEFILGIAEMDFPDIAKSDMGVRLEPDVTVEGTSCYSLCVYEKGDDNDVTLNYYAVTKDGIQWYRLDPVTNEYSVGAQG